MLKKLKALLIAIAAPALYVVSQSIALVAVLLVKGGKNVLSDLTDLDYLNAFMAGNSNYILLISGIVTVGFALLFVQQSGRSVNKSLALHPCSMGTTLSVLGAGIGLNVLTVMLMNLIPVPDRLMEQYQQATQYLINPKDMLLTIFAIALVIPITEEVIFRGIVFAGLRSAFSLPFALILQALIFSAAHFNIVQGVYVFIPGLVLGLVYHWCRSLPASILFHAAFNATSLALSGGGLNSSVLIQVLIFSPLLVLVCLRYLYRHRKKEAY